MFQLSDKQIQVLNTLFNVLFITIIVLQVIRKALYTLPDKWLFFLTSDAVEYFIFSVIAYLLYYYVLRRNQLWYKISFIVLFIVLIVLVALLKSYRIHNEVLLDRSFDFSTEFIGKTFLFYFLIYFINRLDFFNRYKNLENELNQAKGQLLRNQLHPHFLFNAFNSLYSMSLKNSPDTPNTILKLSGMMRYLTDDSTNKRVKLTQELKFIEEYIAIEKIRFGDQATIKLSINGIAEGKNIEPLLLITLVENAFKHGFYINDQNAFVSINIICKNHIILFKVENSILDKQHFNVTNRKGKGIESLKKRLAISYPKKHNLVLQHNNDIYSANLEINLG
ncbi:Histidine kinase [Aquimarina amphilecti]|uniref:Histidine kinase n=1 Tax=Aquimarina amphilecti TaxID=1038014 RepID=A0A1H7HF29_AQUAM|nr:histidine kinase [Aquimarina amphilecti]SEK47560.1 Histidine kinase [Aquimarina amphilecti]